VIYFWYGKVCEIVWIDVILDVHVEVSHISAHDITVLCDNLIDVTLKKNRT
jgi:hypothetical protein